MKILMILSKEILTDGRVYREAKTLVEAGHDVAVIVWDRRHEHESEEVYEEIKIFRIYNKGLMKILPNDLFRNPLWWRKAYKKGLELYKNDYKFDVVHCHDLDTLQAGVWLKKKLGVKLIYDAHEIFGHMISPDMPKIVVKAAFWLEKKLVKHIDHIITVNEPLKNYLGSISDKPITILMNCKELISEEYIPPKNDLFTLVYIGTLHKNRFFPELIDVVGNIKKVKLFIAAKKENLRLYEDVKKRCKKYSNIDFLGEIPSNEVIPTTMKSDAVIALIDPDSKYAPIMTMNKQFEAMVCGRPIIVTKGTNPGKMTEKLKCGITVHYNKKSVEEGIIKLRNDPKLREKLGKNALKAAIEKYNWENEKRKLLKLYENLY